VAEIQSEHLYAVVIAFDYQNVFSGDLHWGSFAGAEQMLAQAVRRRLNAPHVVCFHSFRASQRDVSYSSENVEQSVIALSMTT
jgi:hypothetical protein